MHILIYNPRLFQILSPRGMSLSGRVRILMHGSHYICLTCMVRTLRKATPRLTPLR